MYENDDVLANVVKIIQNGFVVIRSGDRSVVGLVTTSDLAVVFERLSGPFLKIGLVERKLRQIAATRFDRSVIASAARTATSREGDPVDHLTLGELKSLFDSADNWNQLGWTLDPAVFRELLEQVIQLRNQVMRFRGSEPDRVGLSALRNLTVWLTYLVE